MASAIQLHPALLPRALTNNSPGVQVPSQVYVTDKLPKTATGKIQRRHMVTAFVKQGGQPAQQAAGGLPCTAQQGQHASDTAEPAVCWISWGTSGSQQAECACRHQLMRAVQPWCDDAAASQHCVKC